MWLQCPTRQGEEEGSLWAGLKESKARVRFMGQLDEFWANGVNRYTSGYLWVDYKTHVWPITSWVSGSLCPWVNSNSRSCISGILPVGRIVISTWDRTCMGWACVYVSILRWRILCLLECSMAVSLALYAFTVNRGYWIVTRLGWVSK